MADTETAVLEQAPPEAPEATPAPEVEAPEAPSTEPVAEGAGEPAGDGALVEPAPPAEPSSLEELQERYPWLAERVKERDRERENAGAQRREAQLRREAGSKERVKQDMAVYLQAIGVDPSEAVQVAGQQIQRAEFLYTLAEARAASDLAEALPDILKTEYAISPEVRERAARHFDTPLNEQGDRDHRGYLRILIDGAVESELSKREAQLRKDLEAENRKWRADEERAMRAQATPQPAGAPAVPVAQATGSSVTISNMHEADAAYNAGLITLQQYRQYRQQYGVGVAPGGGR